MLKQFVFGQKNEMYHLTEVRLPGLNPLTCIAHFSATLSEVVHGGFGKQATCFHATSCYANTY